LILYYGQGTLRELFHDPLDMNIIAERIAEKGDLDTDEI